MSRPYATRREDAPTLTLGIDASNIRSGGGLTHLVELLNAANPAEHGFAFVVVWACKSTLARLPDQPWLRKHTDPVLEKNFLRRGIWQYEKLGKLAKSEGVDLLFAPGGSLAAPFKPSVTMSQNMLPFQWTEMRRFGFSLVTLKMLLLRMSQTMAFKRADGTIFLTQYARDSVTKITGPLAGEIAIVPHGISERFSRAPKPQQPLNHFSATRPLRVVYVSIVDVYKHQWQVVRAIKILRDEGLPIALDLIGPGRPSALKRLKLAMDDADPNNEFATYHGMINHDQLDTHYAKADICVFASSCENMPNILVESMAAALPIACSNREPMPEVLGAAGVYFDPEIPSSIADAVRALALNPTLRAEKANQASRQAQQYSWLRCAEETFDFLAKIAQSHRADQQIANRG